MEGTKLEGTVKWFNEEKGYGFIVQDSGEGDVFVHVNNIPSGGLADGARVSFNLSKRPDGRFQAVDVIVL